MGGGGVTVRNLKVLRVDVDNHLLLVKTSTATGYVIVRKAIAARSRWRRSRSRKGKK